MKFILKADFYEIGLTLWQFIGEHKGSVSNGLILLRMNICTSQFVVLLFIFANFSHVQGSMYVSTFEVLVSVTQVVYKYIVIMYYKIEINKIIRIRHDRFWKSLYLDEKLAKSISAIYKVVRTIEVGAFVIGYIIMVLQFLKPTFLEDSPYLFYSWVFVDSLPLEVCTLAFQYCSMLLAMPSILGLDLVFLYICVDLIIQMKLVKFQLQLIIRESTLGDDGLKQIKEIVQHHLVLLSVFDDIKSIFSITMLFHYYCTLFTVCTVTYGLVLSNPSIGNIFLTLSKLLFLWVEFWFYASIAEQVSFEFADISDTIYMSYWYRKTIEIQKCLLLIMAKSQRMQYFSGAGLMEANVNAFGSLIRKTFSFYAIIKNMANM